MVFDSVNEILSPFEPWQIVIATGAATILLLKITTFLAGQYSTGVISVIKSNFYSPLPNDFSPSSEY